MIARLVFVILLAVGHARAKKVLTLPFDCQAEGMTRLNFTIGTPGQQVTFLLFEKESQRGADVVVHSSYNPEGAFYRDDSSTFKVVGPLYNYLGTPIGVNATDVFLLGDEKLQLELPFRYYVDPFYDKIDEGFIYTDSSAFGLNRATDGSLNFVQQILESFEEKTVVTSYDDVTDDWPLYATGVFTLGDKPADRCANDWTIVPEAPWLLTMEQWTMPINDVTFGTHTLDTPGNLYFQQDEWYFSMPQQYTEWFMQALNLHDAGNVPCDLETDVVFSVGGGEIHVTPDEYLDRSKQETSRRCSLNVSPAQYKQFRLPRTAFQRYCLLRDYSNNQIGFATRLPRG